MKPDRFPLGLICGVLLSVAGYLAWANKSDWDDARWADRLGCDKPGHCPGILKGNGKTDNTPAIRGWMDTSKNPPAVGIEPDNYGAKLDMEWNDETLFREWMEQHKDGPLCDKDSPLQMAPGICRLPTREEMARGIGPTWEANGYTWHDTPDGPVRDLSEGPGRHYHAASPGEMGVTSSTVRVPN